MAMAITGHKTRQVFDRYNIINESDLQIAAKKMDTYLSEKSYRDKTDTTIDKVDNVDNFSIN